MLPIFITGNQNKVDYLSRILGINLAHQKVELDEIQSVDPRAVTEHKARQAYTLLQRPVLVEDNSMSFNALGGLPGPFVKFFIESSAGNEGLCRMLDGFSDRSAYSVVVYAYYDGEQLKFFEGRLDGRITESPRGDGGYGWDPIFEPEGYGGRTRAELNAEEDAESWEKLRDLDGLRAFLSLLH